MQNEMIFQYLKIAMAEMQLKQLQSRISQNFVINIPNSQGAGANELRRTVEEMNKFRGILSEAIGKTAQALNNTVVSMKQADEGMKYKP